MFKHVQACGKGRSDTRHAMITCTDTLFFQNREAQSEMPQEAAAQMGCTNRPPILMSLSQNEAGSKRCSEPGETAEKILRLKGLSTHLASLLHKRTQLFGIKRFIQAQRTGDAIQCLTVLSE